ncbi:hypothetical protein AGMMS50230_01380 [Spirochaetia bacterium]|nr:hypothetical protein AGMMS50230_01380 [Spirochaetia bacterium]
MAQSILSVRMDSNLKEKFDALCSEFGMNPSTAVTVFAKTVVRQRKIPFEIGVGEINEGKYAIHDLIETGEQK